MIVPEDAKSVFHKPPPPRATTAASSLTDAERQVLYLRIGARCQHALEPTPFFKPVYEAFFKADRDEFSRLESAFPEQAAAVRRWRKDPSFAPHHQMESH